MVAQHGKPQAPLLLLKCGTGALACAFFLIRAGIYECGSLQDSREEHCVKVKNELPDGRSFCTAEGGCATQR